MKTPRHVLHVWLFNVRWSDVPDEYIMLFIKYRDMYYGVRFDGAPARGVGLDNEAFAAERRLHGESSDVWEKIA